MTPQEAVDLGVEDLNQYFQVGMGKANLAPLSKCKWRKMIGVDLHNGNGLYPFGDTVGVCIEFKPPDAFEGVTIETLKDVQQAITDSDEPFAKDPRNSGWLGYKVAEVLGWDVAEGTTNKKERNLKQNNYRARIAKMISAWIKSGTLSVEEIHDSRRGEDVKSLVVGELVSTVKNNRGG